MLRLMIGVLCTLAFVTSAFAQDKAPVVLVWGEYLAAANAREAPGTRSYMNNIAGALDAVGIGYDQINDSDVEKGALDGYKFAIFPYNSNLTAGETEQIRAFVKAGGKIWASFTQAPVLNELLGVKVSGSIAPQYDGQFASIAFGEGGPAGLPESIATGSWYSHGVTPLQGTKVIGTWADSKGQDTGMPALTMGENGYYHCHVMLGGDLPRKGEMFLALIGSFVPDLWESAVRKAIADVDKVHGEDSWQVVRDAIADARKQGRNVSVSEERLRTATTELDAAKALLEARDYPNALRRALEAKDQLASILYPLAPSREGELRAVWMGGVVSDWDAVMDDLASAGLNAVFPNLCDAGGADYESDVLPKSKGYKQDQLAACIEAARKRNIEVHPWRINWRLGKGTDERIEELRQAGRLSRSKDGEEGDWLCPSDQRNLDLELAAMVEMAQKYPVAGIHFDYIRYLNADFCYCDKCRRNFERDAGKTVETWPGDALRGGPHYDAFQDWRREQITRLVRQVYHKAHEVRPDIVVSAAVFSNWPSSRVSIGQDATAWAKEGIVDLLLPMTYTNDDEQLASLTKQHVELTGGRAIMAEGIGAFSSHSQFASPNKLIDQIEIARSLGADGFCIFSYGNSLKQGFLEALGQGCTGPRTYTPMLRPPASFKVAGDEDGEWVLGPGESAAVAAEIAATGPWTTPVAAVKAALQLQGLDGRTIRPLSEEVRVGAGESASLSSDLSLEPGGYRLALSGTVTFEDGSEQPFICRSKPLSFVAADDVALREGRLPAPSPVKDRNRVAVLDGYGAGGIVEALESLWQVETVLVPAIDAAVAQQYQIIVVTQGRGAPAVDETMAKALHGWLEAGGSILTTHDAVGYRGHAVIAPEVCAGGVTHEKDTRMKTGSVPPVPEEYRGLELEHAFVDHIVLKPGPAGAAVMNDLTDRPLILAGPVGKGRYVASGVAFGLNTSTKDEVPGEHEVWLLRELVLWLARLESA